MQVRKVKEATSEIHEKLQGADESYWTVFPVKFTRTILARIDLLLIQITERDGVTSWKNIGGSRVLKKPIR